MTSDIHEARSRAGKKGARAKYRTDIRPANLRTARPIAQLRSGRTDWYRIENVTRKGADVYIYDEIGYFGITAGDFVQDLNDISSDEITLHVNSPGGSIFDGFAIFNSIENHPSRFTAQIEGLAASCASFIVQACDEIRIARNAQMMIHEASAIVIGGAKDMRDMADELERLEVSIANHYAERAGGTPEDWAGRMEDETWYTAKEAVDAGLADSVMERDSNADNSWDMSVFKYRNRDEAPAPVVPEETETPGAPVEVEPPLDPATTTGKATVDPEQDPPIEDWQKARALAFARLP